MKSLTTWLATILVLGLSVSASAEPLPAAEIRSLTEALDLLRAEKMLVVQGSGFNWPEPDHFRIVTLPRVEQIEEAMPDLADGPGSDIGDLI